MGAQPPQQRDVSPGVSPGVHLEGADALGARAGRDLEVVLLRVHRRERRVGGDRLPRAAEEPVQGQTRPVARPGPRAPRRAPPAAPARRGTRPRCASPRGTPRGQSASAAQQRRRQRAHRLDDRQVDVGRRVGVVAGDTLAAVAVGHPDERGAQEAAAGALRPAQAEVGPDRRRLDARDGRHASPTFRRRDAPASGRGLAPAPSTPPRGSGVSGRFLMFSRACHLL